MKQASQQASLELIHAHLVKKHGQAHADKWLETASQPSRVLPSLKRASDVQVPEQVAAKTDSLVSHSRQSLSPNSKEADTLSHENTASTNGNSLPEALKHQISRLKGKLTPQAPKLSPQSLNGPLNPQEVTQKLSSCLKDTLSQGELKTYQFLHTMALLVASARNYAASVTSVTYFCPTEIIAYALGIHRTTLWRHLKILLELGLVDQRPHKTTYKGQVVNDGSLWCIKLHPKKGKTPRLSYQELKAVYRDLGADIKAGRTAFKQTTEPAPQTDLTLPLLGGHDLEPMTYFSSCAPRRIKVMQQSNKLTKDLHAFDLVFRWTLTPLATQSPVRSDCCTAHGAALETLLDLPYSSKQDRNEMVDLAASSIAFALGDAKSHAFYCKLLWNLIRRHDQGQDDFSTVYQMILRVRVDYQEGFARSAGALFISRLKDWTVWEELQRTPQFRVGSVPLAA